MLGSFCREKRGKLSRDERGIGSLVGAIFLILILMSGFAFYVLSVNVTDEYRETLRTMDQLDLKRKQEKIEFVSVSTTDDDQLNITLKNTGPHQTHLIWLRVSDETTLPTQKYYPLNRNINPAETETNIGPDEMGEDVILEGHKYTIQLVTELGNMVEHKFYPASEVSCELTLMALPPTVYKGNNVTVLLIVTHNDTEVDAIQRLTVILEAEPTDLVEVKEEPSSLLVEGLQRGESAFFNWIYNTVDTGTVTFNATYEQAPAGTYALSTVEITEESPPSVRSFGVFSLDWFYFKYSSKQTYQEHPGEPEQSAGSISKAEDYIAFYVKVINNWDESVTISGLSMVMLLIEWQEPLFYIVEDVEYAPDPSITPYGEGNPITVAPEESVVLKFAAKLVGEDDWTWGDSTYPDCGWWGCGDLPIGIAEGDTPEGAIAMTALVFTIGDSPDVQAQSLPFQALVLDE